MYNKHIKHIQQKILIMLCFIAFLSCSTAPDKNDRGIVIPFTIENGLIILEATINRNTGRFFWDSGANFSIFPGARRNAQRWYFTL